MKTPEFVALYLYNLFLLRTLTDNYTYKEREREKDFFIRNWLMQFHGSWEDQNLYCIVS